MSTFALVEECRNRGIVRPDRQLNDFPNHRLWCIKELQQHDVRQEQAVEDAQGRVDGLTKKGKMFSKNSKEKTEAMKVGSSFCSGIPSAGGNLMYANVRIPPDHTRIPSLTKVDKIASCSSLSSAASLILPRIPFFLGFFSSSAGFTSSGISHQERQLYLSRYPFLTNHSRVMGVGS